MAKRRSNNRREQWLSDIEALIRLAKKHGVSVKYGEVEVGLPGNAEVSTNAIGFDCSGYDHSVWDEGDAEDRE